jgi:O-antigen/teichoic acid export membrane protein
VLLCTLEHLMCFLLVALSFRKTKIRLTYDIRTSGELLSRGYHFILSDLLVMIYTRMDKIILKQFKGTATLGIYSVAVTIADMWTLIPSALITSARPKIMGNLDNKALFEKQLRQLYAAIFYFGVFCSLAIFILGKFVIGLLYGDAYSTARIPMAILAFSSIFAMLGTARSIWIVSLNLQKYTKYFTGIGAAVNLTLDLLLVSNYGMIGSALATLISQILVALISPAFFKETRHSSVLMIQGILLRGIF